MAARQRTLNPEELSSISCKRCKCKSFLTKRELQWHTAFEHQDQVKEELLNEKLQSQKRPYLGQDWKRAIDCMEQSQMHVGSSRRILELASAIAEQFNELHTKLTR